MCDVLCVCLECQTLHPVNQKIHTGGEVDEEEEDIKEEDLTGTGRLTCVGNIDTGASMKSCILVLREK